MEKYCPKCNKIFEDMKDNYCSKCGGELMARHGRVPLPQGLRNEVLKRDGYRCVRCGASKDDTDVRLEIDHILPVAKGGTNDIDNLQTLCHDCNINKGAIIEDNDEIEIKENELNTLKNVISKKEESLKITNDEDERIDLEFEIITLKKQIPIIENEIKQLKDKRDKEEEEFQRKQKEKERKDRLFKKIYVELEKEDDEIYQRLCKHFSLNYQKREENLKNLTYNYLEEEIYNAITSIKQIIEKEKEEKIKREKQIRYDKYFNLLNDENIDLIKKEISLEGSKKEIIIHLINNYTDSELDEGIKFIKETIKKEKEEKIKREKQILYEKICNSLDDEGIELIKNEFSLNGSKKEIIIYLMNNYAENEINELKQELLEKKLFDELNQKDIFLISHRLKIPFNKKKVVDYLIKNYTLVEIEDLKRKCYMDNELEKKWKYKIKHMENELFSELTPAESSVLIDRFSISSRFSATATVKRHLIMNYSKKEIKDILSETKAKILSERESKIKNKEKRKQEKSMTKKKCPKCKSEVYKTSKRCSYCGYIFRWS